MKVLHVVESFGGGVVTALLSYVEATPELEHHLLRKERSASLSLDKELERIFASVNDLPKSFSGARTAVKKVVRKLNPAVVHAHSSLAGAIVRTSISSNTRSIVYTPHCYAFERRDVSNIARRAFWLVEKLLARNTTVVAACSTRELQLAEDLRNSQTAIHVPNASAPKAQAVKNPRMNNQDLPTVIGVGRLSAQKDPIFFAEVIRMLRQEIAVRGVWIGDGEADYLTPLVDAQVMVTGWLTEEEVFRELSTADVYLHSAQWEGMPLSLLEANALDLPIVARRVESMSWVPKNFSSETVEGISQVVQRLLTNIQEKKNNREEWQEMLGNNNLKEQRRSLFESYGFKEDARSHV